MKIKKYIEKIVEEGTDEDMEKLSDMLIDLIYDLKRYDEEKAHKYKMCLYKMVYGEVLSEEMKREWVKEMKPNAKWSEEQVKTVVTNYGSKVPYMSAYVIMNMLYSDMQNSFGEGDTEESLKKYLQGTYDWYFDKDVGTDGEEKLFNYKMYVVK